MSFGVVKSGGNSEGSNVDYSALNKYMVETCKLESPEALTGIISGIIDFGMQEQEDAAMEFQGTPEMEAEEMAKEGSNTYFETMKDYGDGGKEKRYKRWPVKPCQTVGLTVDFPDIMIDKGQFFGDDSGELKPLRMVLGGTFNGVFARQFPLNVRKNDKTNNKWSMPHNSMLHKMAVASKLVTPAAPFLPEQIDQLLGQALQFEVTIGMRAEYLNEKIKYMGALGRGMQVPVLDDKYKYMIQFGATNDVTALKHLSSAAKKTMAMSPDFATSVVGKQLAELRGEPQIAPPVAEVSEPAASPSASTGVNEPNFDDEEETPPF